MPKALPITKGTRFGRLVTTEYLGPVTKCVCDCDGSEVTVLSTKLRQGKTQSCGCLQKERARASAIRPLKPGTKRLRLTFVNQVGYSCECKCDCGNTTYIDRRKFGYTISCGCRLTELCAHMSDAKSLAPGEAAFNSLFKQYKAQAKLRDLDFSLTEDEFRSYTKENCSYCLASTSNTRKASKSVYTYNGIDRIDNSRGYVSGNCAPCCGKCNRYKGSLSTYDFEVWVRTVVSYQNAGCPKVETLLIEHSQATNVLLNRYKNTARFKKLDFWLTGTTFVRLISGSCDYCGTVPSRKLDYLDVTIKYNGIDRIDTSKGYLEDNCCSCCWQCNNAKGTSSAKAFLDHVRLIHSQVTSP